MLLRVMRTLVMRTHVMNNLSDGDMQAPADLFQDLANIEMVGMLNEGFCELHHKMYCPPSEELIKECGKVWWHEEASGVFLSLCGQSVETPLQSCMYAFVHAFTHSFSCSFVCLFLCSSIRSFVGLFIRYACALPRVRYTQLQQNLGAEYLTA